MKPGRGRWARRIRWLSALCVVAVLAVNAAGVWAIAVARRGVDEEEVRLIGLETTARARSLESFLSQARADLAFLAGSSAIAGIGGVPPAGDRGSASSRRRGAESALLLFLRGHPEVTRLALSSSDGRIRVQTGWRGGVPVLWHPSYETAGPTAAPADRRPIKALIAFDRAPDEGRGISGGDAPVRLEAEIGPASFLSRGDPGSQPHRACSLRDGAGTELGREAGAPADAMAGTGAGPGGGAEEAGVERLSARALVRAEGWSAPSPWTLECGQGRRSATLLEPIMARYRTTLALNLAVMALTLLLGSFAIQQGRHRERLEAAAREEARVRELERQLFHAERLGTVGRLAAGMAHEINNPLEGMSNYLCLARDDLARGDAGSAGERLEKVQEGIDRAAGIVRQVLAHADPAVTPRTPVEVRSVLLQTVDFVKSRQEFGGIEFGVDLGNGPLVVRGSSVMLGQVVLNLVLNACEAQPRGGEVRVRAWRQDGQVRVEIADRGPGVPPNVSARIFEPFFSTKQSSGLGLSVCHSIVRQHEGELTVEDRTGGGAIFTLRLPAAEGA